MRLKNIMAAAALAGALACGAQQQDKDASAVNAFAGYRDALANLEQMRRVLATPGPGEHGDSHLQAGLARLDIAILDIKDAFPGIQFDPKVKQPVLHGQAGDTNRLVAARDFGQAAQFDVRKETDWEFAGGLRGRVLDQIEPVIRSLDRLIEHAR